MAESYMNGAQLQSEEVVTSKITIGGISATGIADDVDTGNPDDLIKLQAMEYYLARLQEIYDSLKPNSSFLQDITVFTPSLVDRNFNKAEDWVLKGWALTGNTAQHIGSGENSIAINLGVYPNAAANHYFVDIAVTSLPNGKLSLYVGDKLIKDYTSIGEYTVEVVISDPSEYVSLVATGQDANDAVVISRFGFHYLTTTFVKYMVTKIRALATVDASEYVLRDELDREFKDFAIQFETITNAYLEKLKAHQDAHNPHEITYSMIGAAPKIHEHEQYATKVEVANDIARLDLKYAPIVHAHDEYLTPDEARPLVDSIVTTRISEIVSVDPAVINLAPVGRLPARYNNSDISPRAQIFASTYMSQDPRYAYDERNGIVDTSIKRLVKEAPKVFARTGDYATIPTDIDLAQHPIEFRLILHVPRTMTGYTMSVRGCGALPNTWTLLTDNSAVVHSVVDAAYEQAGDSWTFTTKLNKPLVDFTELILVIKSVEHIETGDAWQLRFIPQIEADEESIRTVPTSFRYSIPEAGATKVIIFDNPGPLSVPKPALRLPNMPYYIYGIKTYQDATPRFTWSYIPPEYSNERKGVDVFLDVFPNSYPAGQAQVADSEAAILRYNHPVFGDLTLREGRPESDSSMLDIYRVDGNSFVCAGDTPVTIEQEIRLNNAVATGYLLSWRESEADMIPDSWSVTIYGKDEVGAKVVQVVDSVEQFYPFYSVEDDDIVHYKRFDKQLIVSKIVISMRSNDPARKIALNRLAVYLSEYWFSLPQNAMYHGLTKSAGMCLATIHYDPQLKWIVDNYYLGNSCVIPINGLEECEMFGVYTVPNPLHTDRVTATVKTYTFTKNSTVPYAYITEVTPELITVACKTPGRFAIQLFRTW